MRVLESLDALGGGQFDVCVVGSGPVGLTLAAGLAARGRSVIVLEAGGRSPQPNESLANFVEIQDSARHAGIRVATGTGLGGTSAYWGGRCVPLDPIDFEPREYVPSGDWPISHSDVQPFFDDAAKWLGCGGAVFQDAAKEGFTRALSGKGVNTNRLERWCNDPYTPPKLASAKGVTVVVNAAVLSIDLNMETGAVSGLRISQAGRPVRFANAGAYVLACGGLASAKLLLELQTRQPALFGGADGTLGRYYQGHVFGQYASIAFRTPDMGQAFGYALEAQSAARRRITLSDEVLRSAPLPNISFQPANPRLADATHRNGFLSALYVTLSMPYLGKRMISEGIRETQMADASPIGAHLRNLVNGLPSAMWQMSSIARQKFLEGRKKPFFFLHAQNGQYPLSYHAEHIPNRDSRVKLAGAADEHGRRTLHVDLRFSEADARGVVQAHRILAKASAEADVANVAGLANAEAEMAAVLTQARDGFHQIGLTRMGRSPDDGVVDQDCKVFGTQNLFLAGSGVFRTSGQANPTYFAAALALRLAAQLSRS